jgi:hypothetical protein
MCTKELLEKINNHCYAELTKYRFTKNPSYSQKYKKGKVASLEYISNLTYHFFERDKVLKDEFESLLVKEIDRVSTLKDSEYKQAILDSLLQVQKELSK